MPRGRYKIHSRSQSSQQVSPMQLRRVAISALKPAPYNPRVDLAPGHPTFEKLRRSIDTFGTVEPIVWNRRTGHVVGGHQRLSVLKHLGHTHVDVVVVDLDLPQEKTLNLALNRIVGEWDEGKLAELLKDLIAEPSLDIGLTGFDSDEIDHVLANVTTTEGAWSARSNCSPRSAPARSRARCSARPSVSRSLPCSPPMGSPDRRLPRSCKCPTAPSSGIVATSENDLERRASQANTSIYVETIKNRVNKQQRIMAIEAEVSQGMIAFSKRHSLLLEQLRSFPGGKHDDGPDALEMAVTMANKPCGGGIIYI